MDNTPTIEIARSISDRLNENVSTSQRHWRDARAQLLTTLSGVFLLVDVALYN